MNQTLMVPSPATALPFKPAAARIAMLSAGWHAELLAHARHRFRATLREWGVPDSGFLEHEVPGAFEIPLAAQRLARGGKLDAIVAFALVVDGGIYRHEFVATAVIDGLMRVQLDEGVPVLSVVLTPQAFHDHDDHRRFFAGHLELKGDQAAAAVMQLLSQPLPTRMRDLT
jgi:6,7-dimethyl-8-ribityllumazine synthase